MNCKTGIDIQYSTERSLDDLNLEIQVGLSMPGLDEAHPLNSMLNGAFLKQLGDRRLLDVKLPLWPSEYFNLNRTKLFSETTLENQLLIQIACSRALVEEVLLIEKCGMAFGLKMAVLSETVEERMFYNLMTVEETVHYHQVRQFLPDKGESVSPSAFHHLLSNVIEEGDRNSLMFFIQVVLEGWGLSHYKSLAQSCSCGQFSKELKEILKDEARHHGSGTIFTKERAFSTSSCEYITGIMRQLLKLVQLGSQSVLDSVEKVCGALSHADKIALLKQLDSEQESANRLNLLRQLMMSNGAESIVHELDAMNCFEPLPVERCI